MEQDKTVVKNKDPWIVFLLNKDLLAKCAQESHDCKEQGFQLSLCITRECKSQLKDPEIKKWKVSIASQGRGLGKTWLVQCNVRECWSLIEPPFGCDSFLHSPPLKISTLRHCWALLHLQNCRPKLGLLRFIVMVPKNHSCRRAQCSFCSNQYHRRPVSQFSTC